MKRVKPSKQTLLKGLLLLVVGLNFSWRPFLTDKGQASLASDKVSVTAPKDRQLGPDGSKGKLKGDDQFISICGDKYLTLEKDIAGNVQVKAGDAEKNVLHCKACDETKVHLEDTQPITKETVQSVQDLLHIGCTEIKTAKELEEEEAKKKQAEEDKIQLAKDIVLCNKDKKGNDLDDDKKVDCEAKHLDMSDSDMKKAGIDKESMKGLRDELAKKVLKDTTKQMNADIKECKKSRKDDMNFDGCNDILAKYDDVLSSLSDSEAKGVKSGAKSLSDKLTKFKGFVKEENESAKRVTYFQAQYEMLNNAMQKSYANYSSVCDAHATEFAQRGQNFNVQACIDADVKHYVIPQYEPQLRQLKTQFTAEENKYARDFKASAKFDLVGEDGAVAALNPWIDATKNISSIASDYMTLPAADLPQIQGDTSLGLAANPSTIAANSGRFSTVLRQVVPSTATTGVQGTNPNGYAIPKVLAVSGSPTATQNYRAQLPVTQTQNKAVTAGAVLVLDPGTSAGLSTVNLWD